MCNCHTTPRKEARCLEVAAWHWNDCHCCFCGFRACLCQQYCCLLLGDKGSSVRCHVQTPGSCHCSNYEPHFSCRGPSFGKYYWINNHHCWILHGDVGHVERGNNHT
nr:WAT1-related protein At3g28050-like isoform X2 [Ipomoea batatas]